MKINISTLNNKVTKEDILYRINYLKAQNEKLKDAQNKTAKMLVAINEEELKILEKEITV